MQKKKLCIIGMGIGLLALSPLARAAAKADTKAAAKTSTADSAKAEEKPAAAETAKAEEAPKQEKAAKDEGSEKAKTAEAHHKSAALAGGLAFFPGIAVHGAGHMYAGSWMKGFGLLAIEGVAIGGIVQSVGGLTDAGKVLSGGKSIPTDVSGVYTNIGLVTVSSMALLWTWFDDMAGAPVAVAEYNKMQDQNASAQFRVAPRGDGAELALSTNF